MSKPPHVIEQMFVAVATDKQTGDEGVCGVLTDAGWVPLVASDRIRLERVMQTALRVAEDQQMLVRVVRFDTREEVMTYDYRPKEERN